MLISHTLIANAQASNSHGSAPLLSGPGPFLRDMAVTGGSWMVKLSYQCSRTEICSWLPSMIHAINSWIGETAEGICTSLPACGTFTESLGTVSRGTRSWCYSTDWCSRAADEIHAIYHDALLLAVSDAYSSNREE